ncbi:MAG: lysophospholipid acyltransferase family protein [Methylotetracoccus sp.]
MNALRRFVRTIYEYLVLYGALTVFGTGGLIYTAVSPLLSVLLPRNLGNTVGQRVMMGLFRFFVGLLSASGIVRFDLKQLDRLRGEPLVIAPNHPSLLDAVLIVSRLPDVVCIMKAQILDNPFLGGGARLAGYIRGDHPVEMMHKAREALDSGRQVLVFPEGTRTQRWPLNPFKGNFALIAKQAKVPIQTVLLSSDSDYLTPGWTLFRKPRFPIHFRAELGERFEARAETRELREAVEAYFRDRLANGGGAA